MADEITLEFCKQVEAVAERIGFDVSGKKPTSKDFCFCIYSPYGHDFEFTIYGTSLEEIIEEVLEEWQSFDVSYETYLHLDSFGHGKSGAPYDMKDIYEDMQWCKDKIEELLEELRKEVD